jgi:DNA (cytosine-5)-methyltransferase 1
MTHAGNPTLISLFAGAGGLDIGLEQAGFECLAANEITPHACKTLIENQRLGTLSKAEFESWFSEQVSQRCYGGLRKDELQSLRKRIFPAAGKGALLPKARIIREDIRSLKAADLVGSLKKPSDVTLIAGGPPCQPFSRAGKRETVETADGRLFLDFVRLVNEIHPRWFLFENVKGLTISKTDVLRIACKSCRRSSAVTFDEREVWQEESSPKACRVCGSKNVSWQWSHDRGGSLEIILNEFESIGYHCKFSVLNAADFGAPQMRERLFIVGSRDNEKFHWPDTTHAKTISGGDSELLLFHNEQKKPWLPMKSLWTDGHPRFGKLDSSKAVLWVKNVVRPHDEPVTWPLERPSPTIGAHQSAKLALAPNGVPEEQLKRQQWHVLGKRQKDSPPVHVEHEYLSDLELLKLQTFPPYWYLYGTRMERASQIGNAVPPILARSVGEAIANACGKVTKAKAA